VERLTLLLAKDEQDIANVITPGVTTAFFLQYIEAIGVDAAHLNGD